MANNVLGRGGLFVRTLLGSTSAHLARKWATTFCPFYPVNWKLTVYIQRVPHPPSYVTPLLPRVVSHLYSLHHRLVVWFNYYSFKLKVIQIIDRFHDSSIPWTTLVGAPTQLPSSLCRTRIHPKPQRPDWDTLIQ
jgi:hypothetical protein